MYTSCLCPDGDADDKCTTIVHVKVSAVMTVVRATGSSRCNGAHWSAGVYTGFDDGITNRG